MSNFCIDLKPKLVVLPVEVWLN